MRTRTASSKKRHMGRRTVSGQPSAPPDTKALPEPQTSPELTWRRVLEILTHEDGESYDRDPYECGIIAGVYDGVRERLAPYPACARPEWRRGYRHGLAVALSALPRQD